MSTFEHDPVIASLASRARDQVQAGLKELHGGNLLAAEVFLNAACATMQSLVVLLDSPAPAKPMRKLCLVIGPASEAEDRFPEVREYEEEPLPAWMHTKKGGPDGSAA